MSPSSASRWVEVAVALPFADRLTYEIPTNLLGAVRVGQRVRVPVGKRRHVGVVVGFSDDPPAGITTKPIETVLDPEPVLPAELLELAGFVATYYRAPLGEVVRGLVPGDLPPWGGDKVRLTAGGAVAPPRNELEGAVVELLRAEGRLSPAELQARLGAESSAGLAACLEGLARDGRVSLDSPRRQAGGRYQTAYELVPATTAERTARIGRSLQGRAVVDYVAALGRPVSKEELSADLEVSAAVLRRLVALEVLRPFTQVERLDLERHVMARPAGSSVVLRPDQETAVSALMAALDEERYQGFLLVGMTGSGKTEVYLRAARYALDRQRSVLLLVPEIALVPALAREVKARFGDTVAILHSGLGSGERHQEWERIRRGEARLVVGPRSALFAPVVALGLVVVDEEQDPAYKQDSVPRYHGRDLALVRAQHAGAVALLASATPSLESRWNVERGKLARLELTERAGKGGLPEGILVDLREEGVPRRPGEVVFSKRLQAEITRAAEEGDQVILLRNRRGYAPMLLCRACGEDHRCPDCGLPRTLHRKEPLLVCHYCGSTRQAPVRCETCGEEALEPIGSGTERVEETFHELFPDLPVGVLDRDSVRREGAAAVLARFARGETRVLVGTQMVSKGHHFPNVALTAVLSADSYLGFADFRAVERTYSLMVQVAGRAGRGDRPGRVVIQSYHPNHYAIQAALANDDERFAREEKRFRHAFFYPPYSRLAQILVRDRDRHRAEAAAQRIARRIEEHPERARARIAGPVPAAFERLRGEWRFQILVRAAHNPILQRLLDAAMAVKEPVEVVVDVDAYQLL
ncbi:MAG: primosomal protein N' [Thermoanaerobaculia bacterium]|nr:primosomal protein N' [Thermoanaerobaculia bacterium]